ncbi:Crooked neck-like protein 1 [Coelomomyces lativittatus]|nr:Crooked neck-like protein 1 [Coelomomyces lativittatus]
MEEVLGNIAGARQVFERWMKWRPPVECWESYISFELRYKEIELARDIYQRLVTCHPAPINWIKFARFEENHQANDMCREVYEKAIETLGDQYVTAKLLHSFAKFEIRQKELERARAIYKYALTKLPKSESEAIYQDYIHFEKQFGSQKIIETVVADKRRWVYDQEIKANPYNYDIWFDLIRLEEEVGDLERIRETYEKAVGNVPPSEEKRLWRRYIYLWLNYAIFEETFASNFERSQKVFEECIKLIPHKKFTFAKVWLFYAEFLIRRLNLTQVRKTLEYALDTCPKKKLFKGHIELELKLLEFDRVRQLYERYLHFLPENCYAWYKYAEMEKMLGDIDRARAIFELAIQQPILDVPEVLWKSYIVWVSYAKLELQAQDADQTSVRLQNARNIFERANKILKERSVNEERVLLLEAWRDFEQEMGTPEDALKVQNMFPKVVKKRRTIDSTTSSTTEEYYDYIFPDDVTQRPSLKLLSLAQKWKEEKELAAKESSNS